jgi:hypothetical protein
MSDSLNEVVHELAEGSDQFRYEIDEINEMDDEEKANLNYTEEEIEELRKEKEEDELRAKEFTIDMLFGDDDEENKRIIEMDKS